MEKKWFAALLMVAVLVCACWTGACAAEKRETFTYGRYTYALQDDGTVEITKCSEVTGSLDIPNTINGKEVTAIGDGAFSNCESMTYVTIPDSVTKIGVNPFEGCVSLKSIYTSPDSLYFATIDGVLFRKADNALISYPVGNESLTYTIPQGITSIGDRAFYACIFLINVSIPDSVAQIGANPFAACVALKEISLSYENPYFAVADGVLFQKADKALISYPAGSNSLTYTIPQGISTIGDYAFFGCAFLTSVTIPDSITTIGNNAFRACYSLTSATVPDSVTTIGFRSFYNCPNLTLTVPRNSYSAEYAKTNNCHYTYPDANDWLNN